jgi:predicted PurR-regulated permease PerM
VPNKPDAAQRWTLRFHRAWAIIGILILVATAGWVLGRISSAIVPFGLGLLIVLLLRRPVEKLSRYMPRAVAVLLCYLAVFAVLAVSLTFIIPPIVGQVAQFIQAVPRYASQAYTLWDTYIVHPQHGTVVPTWLQTGVIALKDQFVAGAGSWSTAIADVAVTAGSGIATGLFSMVLAFLVGFYVLTDLPRLEREVFVVAGERSREELTHAIGTITRVLGGWLRGTLIQSTVMAVLMSIGLAIVGVPYALALGVIGGVFNVVPYIGPAIVLVLVAAAGLFISPMTAVWALVVVVAVQQLDALVMQPRIMAEQVDLHPLLVIFSLLVGATLFGIPGMVLSIPVAAVLKGLFVFWFEKRTERPIGSEDGVLFRTAKEESASGDAGSVTVTVAAETTPADADPTEPGHSDR